MKRKALEDLDYKLIKAHALDPDHSPLSKQQGDLYFRLVSAAKLRNRYPNLRHAVAFQRAKFPEIGRTTAYDDFKRSARLFHTVHTFDFDFWRSWLYKDINTNISELRGTKTSLGRQIMAIEHANLARLLSQEPKEKPDPKRSEKKQFFIMLDSIGRKNQVDLQTLADMPVATNKEIKALLKGINKKE